MRKHSLHRALPALLFLISLKMHAAGPNKPVEGFSKASRCLALAAYHEARGEPLIGQDAVMHVVLNRATMRKLSVCGVISQKGQFTWYSSKGLRGKVPSSFLSRAQTMLALERSGVREDFTRGATYFTRRNVKARWMRKMKVVAVIGKHKFMREG